MKFSNNALVFAFATVSSPENAMAKLRSSLSSSSSLHKNNRLPPGHGRFLSVGETAADDSASPTSAPTMSGGCPFFPRDGAAPEYTPQDYGFDLVECGPDDKHCETPEPLGNQGLQTNVEEPCLDDIPPAEGTCQEVAESWTPECSYDESLLVDNFTCGCMSDLVQDGIYCQRTCALCSPVLVSKEGFRSGSAEDIGEYDNLAKGIEEYQHPLPRIPCEPYNVTAVADAVRDMYMPDSDVTLDVPPTVRMGFHDAADFDKWAGTGGADGRFYNNPESWYAQSRTVNAGLVCVYKLMGYFKTTSLSAGDAIQICAIVSVEVAGGPTFEEFHFEPGRYDAKGVTHDGMLPGPLGNNNMIRDYFYRSGLNDVDIVALMGGHTLGGGQGDVGSGFTGAFTEEPNEFSNDFYINLVKYENVTDNGCDYFAPGVTPKMRANGGCHPTNEDDDNGGVMQLPTDRALMLDESLRSLVVKFADDKQAFFDQYTKSYKKLSELGRDVSVQWCSYE